MITSGYANFFFRYDVSIFSFFASHIIHNKTDRRKEPLVKMLSYILSVLVLPRRSIKNNFIILLRNNLLLMHSVTSPLSVHFQNIPCLVVILNVVMLVQRGKEDNECPRIELEPTPMVLTVLSWLFPGRRRQCAGTRLQHGALTPRQRLRQRQRQGQVTHLICYQTIYQMNRSTARFLESTHIKNHV